jgi:hypothetical protein
MRLASAALVLLRAGYYRIATPLRIQASGVVLRGEGMGDTGSVLIGTGTGRPEGSPPGGPAAGTLIVIAGASGAMVTENTSGDGRVRAGRRAPLHAWPRPARSDPAIP